MTVDPESLARSLTRLKLTAIRDQLDSLLDEAARRELTLGQALAFLVEREIARKDECRVEMAGKIAHFPMVRDLDGFDFAAQPSLDARQVRELAACRVAHGEALLVNRRAKGTPDRRAKRTPCGGLERRPEADFSDNENRTLGLEIGCHESWRWGGLSR